MNKVNKEQERYVYTHTGVNHEMAAEVEWFEITQFKDNVKKRLRIKRKDDIAVVMFDNYKSTDGVGRSSTQRCFEVPFAYLEGLIQTLKGV